jgi:hypothetical protein
MIVRSRSEANQSIRSRTTAFLVSYSPAVSNPTSPCLSFPVALLFDHATIGKNILFISRQQLAFGKGHIIRLKKSGS